MTSDMFNQFVPAICTGLGLVLVGGVNVLLVRRGLWVRVLATVAALGVLAAGVAALGQPGLLLSTAKLLALGLLPCLLFALRPVPERLAAWVAALQRPRVRFGLVTVAGVVVACGAFVLFDRADDRAMDEATSDLELMHGHAPSVPSPTFRAATDRGTRIVLREVIVPREGIDLRGIEDRMLRAAQLDEQVIRRGPADDHANCHGWVFTGGKFLLSPEDVELIIKENDYQEAREPQPGDLVIYRHSGAIAHSAVVRYVTERQPVLVEGKWGQFGVFLHPPDKCTYGRDYTFYRSSRHGHLLAGLQGPDRSEGQAPSVPAE
jgi:hypothetical protein